MHCLMCSSVNESLQKFQTGIEVDTLKQIIKIVLPNRAIPATDDPIYACSTCLEQVVMFYRIKITSLENFTRLNIHQYKLKGNNDAKFNYLKIMIDTNKVSIKHEYDFEYINCTNLLRDLLSSENKVQYAVKASNSLLNTNNYTEESNSLLVIKQRPFACNSCGKSFTWPSDLEKHTRVHTGERPFKCQICEKSFVQASHLTNHELVHTGQKPHECDLCHKTFNLRSTLIRHERTHGNDRPYHCSVCSKAFKEQSYLKKHMRSHARLKLLGRDTASNSSLNTNNYTEESKSLLANKQKPFACNICGKSFTWPSDLEKHTRIHTGERPFKCQICEKSFVQAAHLTNHELVHTNEKTHKCDVCNKKFLFKRSLVRHEDTHRTFEPVRCDVCNKTFKQPAYLRIHMRSHTGQKQKLVRRRV